MVPTGAGRCINGFVNRFFASRPVVCVRLPVFGSCCFLKRILHRSAPTPPRCAGASVRLPNRGLPARCHNRQDKGGIIALRNENMFGSCFKPVHHQGVLSGDSTGAGSVYHACAPRPTVVFAAAGLAFAVTCISKRVAVPMRLGLTHELPLTATSKIFRSAPHRQKISWALGA